MFIVGGFNVYPAEVEQVLNRHHTVLESAVVGVADRRLGEVGLAYVVPRAANAPTARELIEFCPRLANFKVPRGWSWSPSCPATPPARCANGTSATGPELSIREVYTFGFRRRVDPDDLKRMRRGVAAGGPVGSAGHRG